MLLLKQRDCPIGIHVFEGISVFSRYSLVWYIPCVCMHAYLHIFMLVVTNHTAAILCASVNFSGRYWQLHSYIAKLVFYDGVCGQMWHTSGSRIWTILPSQLAPVALFCILLSHLFQVLRVTELFMPSHQLLPLFSPLGYTKGSLLEQSGVREAVTRYVKSNELASKDNPRCSSFPCQSLTEYIVGSIRLSAVWCTR